MPRQYKTLLALIAVSFVTSCAPTLATRGNFVENERLSSIQQGVSTKDEVAQKIGTPTTTDPFDKNIWFYIGEKTSTKAFFKPKVMDRKILKMTFNQDGLLQSAEEVDKTAGKEIDLVNKTTPTPGREMNIFQQFVGNLGKFNQNSMGGNSRTQQGR